MRKQQKRHTITADQYRRRQRAAMTEADVMREIVFALELAGYRTPATMLALDARRRNQVRGIYARVQQRDARRSGSEKGVPDLLVWRLPPVPEWRPHPTIMYGFELKRPTAHRAKIYPEQRVLAELGCTHIVSSAQEVLAALGEDKK